MKKTVCRLATLSAIFLLFLLPGCKKVTDFLHDHPTGESKNYRITKIVSGWPGDTLRFSYNAYGDPVSIKRPQPSTGSPNWYFFYDSNHRLTDLVGCYGDSIEEQNCECWNRFFYDGAGRIVSDSNYFFPWVDNGNPWRGFFGNIGTLYYTYDSYNRITKVDYYDEEIGPQTTNYSYNSSGNLDGYTYDTQTNFRRTNRVWMFLGRDYSVNNRTGSGISYIYNSAGFPSTITGGGQLINVPSDPTGFSYLKIE